MTEEIRKERLPLDAKLLSEIIIELNISRRSVALYPKGHPIIAESLRRAYSLFEKIFEIRPDITLGISKDTLFVDEYALDRRNPVFREFSQCLHERGIAAVTFNSPMTIEELFLFHEIMATMELYGEALVEKASERGLNHIKLTPVEMSRFQFIEGQLRGSGSGTKIIEDYISGLLNGRLAEAESEGFILTASQDDIASIINNSITEESSDDTYERVITAYIRKKSGERIRCDLFSKFISFTENLKPELKRQFLKRVFSGNRVATEDLEAILSDLSGEDFEKLMKLFQEHSSIIPDTLRNLLNKLNQTKGEVRLAEMITGNRGVLHDIEINEDVLRLFQEDHFETFVPTDYGVQLDSMLRMEEEGSGSNIFEESFRDGFIENTVSGILLELINLDSLKREEFLQILTRLSEFVDIFIDTGRFEEVADIYNAIYPFTLSGRFKDEASGMINYFFRSDQFKKRLMNAFTIWGKLNREGIIKITRAMRLYLIGPIVDLVITTEDDSLRGLFLSILSEMGSDVADEAVRRLDSERADVIRDMIYLIRRCDGRKYTKEVRNFLSHKDMDVKIEALKTLLDFRTPDSLTYLKEYLKSNDPDLRERAVILIGIYKLKQFVPYLSRQLEERDIFGYKLSYKKAIIHSLAQIGDPSSIEALIRVIQSKSLLFRSSLNELKTEIFRTLNKYPLRSIIPIAKIGIKSKNKDISSISRRILEDAGEHLRD